MLLAIPAFAECGNPAVLDTVAGLVRDSYFKLDSKPRLLEIVDVTFNARDDNLGNYGCSGSVRVEIKGSDVFSRGGKNTFQNVGVYKVPFTFEVSRSATDPGKQVIGVNRIRALVPEDLFR